MRKFLLAVAVCLALIFSLNDIGLARIAVVWNPNPVVEQGIKKLDQFFISQVEQNYLKPEGKRVKLLIMPGEIIKQKEELGKLVGFATYSPNTKAITLSECKNDSCGQKIIEAMPHELWHNLFDNISQKGSVFKKSYHGPNPAAINTHAQEKTSSVEYAELKNKLLNLSAIMINLTRINNYLSKLQLILPALNLTEKTDELYRLKKYSPQEVSGLLELNSRVLKGISGFFLIITGYRNQWSDKDFSLNTSPAELNAAKNMLGEIFARLNKYDNLTDELERYGESVSRVKKILDKAMAEEEAELTKKTAFSLEEEKEERGSATRSLFELRQEQLLTGELDLAKAELILAIETDRLTDQSVNDSITLTMVVNAVKIISIFTGNEIMARTVAAMYNLHYGQPNEIFFTPTEADLKFLEKFKYNKQLIFKKGLEKYRLGKKMLADGYSEEEVKAKLEYATNFEYNGRTYSWPEAKFSLQGEIPLAK